MLFKIILKELQRNFWRACSFHVFDAQYFFVKLLISTFFLFRSMVEEAERKEKFY